MENCAEQCYNDGPSTCVAHPNVVNSIRREVKASRTLSRADFRLAARMGLISAVTPERFGFNDGVVYPPGTAGLPALARTATPSRRAARVTTRGTLHALALMTDFSDNVGTRPASSFQQLLFDPNNPGSMTSYYRQLSGGTLNVTGEVVGYVRAPHPYGYYTDGQSGTGERYPHNTPGLLVDALTEFCKHDDLNRFDVDGDGFVDGLFLIHAGGGAEAERDKTKRPHMIWSHKWVLPQPFENQGTKVFAYSTEPEDGRVGVFAHEFGHVLGLPDLYDTTYRSQGVGNWCLMGGGSWGGGGDQPCRMSCWCLAKLEWIKPTIIKTAKTLEVPTLATDARACYRLWTKGKVGPEYFLVENRQKVEMDSSLPGSGLAIWHIDETQSGNTNPLSYLVGLVQADGKRDLELASNAGDGGDLFPGTKKTSGVSDTTTPSTKAHDGSATKVAVSQIKEKNGVVSMRVKV